MPTAKFICESVTTSVGGQRICLRQGTTLMPGQRANDYTQSMPDGDIYISAEPGKSAYDYFKPGQVYTCTIEKG